MGVRGGSAENITRNRGSDEGWKKLSSEEFKERSQGAESYSQEAPGQRPRRHPESSREAKERRRAPREDTEVPSRHQNRFRRAGLPPESLFFFLPPNT